MHLKKRLFGITAAIVVTFVVITSGVLAKQDEKVTICHATASNTNPYVTETVDVSSLGDGHGHNGVNSGDIIPPTPGTDFPNGQNWDTNGQAIWNNNCKIPTASPSPSPSPSVTPTATPTVIPSVTPTVTPSVTPTPTIDPCANNACVSPTATPSATPTVTVTPTATPTPTPSGCTSNCGNSSSGGSNSSNNNSGSNSSSSSPSQPSQEVLAASTMASTGTFETSLMNLMLIGGILFLSAGSFSLFQERRV